MIAFEKQVVLVTGAGRGLGAAYARLFAERGATVVVHDAGVQRDGTGGDATPAREVAEVIQVSGGQAHVETQNLSTREACQELVHTVLQRFGRLDGLVHSAGLVAYKGIANTRVDEWERMRQINIDAPFWLCQAAWPQMIKQNYGRIVLTVSGYGLKAFTDSDVTAYGVGKAAQFGLMNGLAGEGERHNILVNAISPVAATRIFRAQVAANEMTPESVAPAVVLLGSADCPFTGKVVGAVNGRFLVSQLTDQQDVTLEQKATPEQLLNVFAAT